MARWLQNTSILVFQPVIERPCRVWYCFSCVSLEALLFFVFACDATKCVDNLPCPPNRISPVLERTAIAIDSYNNSIDNWTLFSALPLALLNNTCSPCEIQCTRNGARIKRLYLWSLVASSKVLSVVCNIIRCKFESTQHLGSSVIDPHCSFSSSFL